MFNSRTLILLGLSLILAAGAAWTANNWVQMQQSSDQATVEESGTTVVIAAMHLPYGQRIERKHLKMITLPDEAVPDGTFSDPAALEGKIITQELLPGDVLREARISEHIEGATLAALIEPSMRAFTIRVNDVVGVGGFLLPGNRIDVISTRKVGSRSNSETILKDVKVLAVDQTAKTNKNDPVIVRAVTMELSPKQSEKLASYRSDGKIQLTLRNPLDDIVATAPVPKKRIYKKRKPKPVVEAPPEVIIIKGTTWEKKKLPI